MVMMVNMWTVEHSPLETRGIWGQEKAFSWPSLQAWSKECPTGTGTLHPWLWFSQGPSKIDRDFDQDREIYWFHITLDWKFWVVSLPFPFQDEKEKVAFKAKVPRCLSHKCQICCGRFKTWKHRSRYLRLGMNSWFALKDGATWIVLIRFFCMRFLSGSGGVVTSWISSCGCIKPYRYH